MPQGLVLSRSGSLNMYLGVLVEFGRHMVTALLRSSTISCYQGSAVAAAMPFQIRPVDSDRSVAVVKFHHRLTRTAFSDRILP